MNLRSGLILASFGLTSLVACGSEPEPADAPAEAAAVAVPDAVIANAWPVQVAAPGALDKVMSNAGWKSIFERNYTAAAGAFGATGPAATRVHAEAAAIYRQAALTQAFAVIETFKAEERREGDPPDVDYLLGVSYVVAGKLDQARPLLGKAKDASLTAADKAWAARLAAADFKLALATDAPLFPLPEVAAGVLPPGKPAPHYKIKVTVGEGMVDLADPTELLQLALWHEEAARKAGGGDVDALLAPWRLPGEAAVAGSTAALPVEAFFLTGWMTPGDLALAGEIQGGKDPKAALGAHQSDSPYAVVVQACLADASVNVDCLLDKSLALEKQILAAMAKAANGQELADFRVFASFARAGTLRMGSRVAFAMGDERTAAILRVNALDRSTGAVAEPDFILSVTAWDAEHRNPARAKELVHNYETSLPGLQAVQVSLDSLYLRVSRDQGAGGPMH